MKIKGTDQQSWGNIILLKRPYIIGIFVALFKHPPLVTVSHLEHVHIVGFSQILLYKGF